MLRRPGALIDRAFGALPAKNDLKPVRTRRRAGSAAASSSISTCRRRWSPSADRASRATIPISWPPISSIISWAAAAFSSRLYKEVREKRGLAYGVSDSLVWFQSAAVVLGGTATRADRTGDALAMIEQEIKRMADGGPTARRACGRQIIPQRLLCAYARHLRKNRDATHPNSDRQSWYRLYSASRCADRCSNH